MSDELKSAWELAMEKLQMTGDSGAEKLSDSQKAEIAEIRRRYKAKIAEIEISTDSQIRKAAGEGDYEVVEKAKNALIDERNRLNREMEAEVEKARVTKG